MHCEAGRGVNQALCVIFVILLLKSRQPVSQVLVMLAHTHILSDSDNHSSVYRYGTGRGYGICGKGPSQISEGNK